MNRQTSVSERRFDLDWLRVLTILTVFIFHSGRFFDMGDWHVKNPTTYFGDDVWTAFLADWMMPFIFVISGASLYYVIAKGGTGKFVKDKILRLGVPLVVGVFTHAALMVYLERLTHHQFYGSFWEFIPYYFQGWYGFGGNFAWMGLHLWYLLILFLFSLLLYPLFRWLRTGGSAFLNRVSAFITVPGVVYLLALPGMLLISVLDPRTPLGQRGFGGWSFVIYIFFFIYGFVVISSPRLQQRIIGQRWVSLLGGILALLASFASHGIGPDPAFGTTPFVIYNALFALAAWCFILAILGFGMLHLSKTTPYVQYANEAVLPFYVLHQTVLLSVGYFVVQSALPDLLKWLVIAVISFSIILGLYEFLIRRINVLRFLFGMKLLRRAPVTAGRPATAMSGR
jgi:glucan biosynthesis protein C